MQEVDGGAFYCLQESSSSSTDPSSQPGMLFGAPAMVPYGFSRYATTHVCNPWPLQELWDSNGMVVQVRTCGKGVLYG